MYYVIHVFPIDSLAHLGPLDGYVEYVEECRDI